MRLKGLNILTGLCNATPMSYHRMENNILRFNNVIGKLHQSTPIVQSMVNLQICDLICKNPAITDIQFLAFLCYMCSKLCYSII